MNTMHSAVAMMVLALAWTVSAAEWSTVPFNTTDMRFYEGAEAAFDLNLELRGSKHTNPALKQPARVEGQTRVWKGKVVFMGGSRGARKSVAQANLDYRATAKGAQTAEISVSLAGEAPNLGATLRWLPRRSFSGEARAVDAAGKTTSFRAPTYRKEEIIDGAVLAQVAGGAAREADTKITERPDVVRVEIPTADGKPIVMAWNRPVRMTAEAHEIKFDLGPGAQAAIDLPATLQFEPAHRVVDTSDWFELQLNNDHAAPSVAGMQDWMHTPAGKHGRLLEKGDRLEFEDGTPAVFWGAGIVNPLPERSEAFYRKRAELMRKYGMNVTRIGAFLRPAKQGWAHYGKLEMSDDALQYDKMEMDFLDRDFATLKEHGVYTCLTPFYGLWLSEADKKRFANYEEAKTLLRNDGFFKDSFYGHMSLVPEACDIAAERHAAFLNHVNPYTKLRYADDPAIIRIEIQNEDCGFLTLHKLDAALKNAPTYRQTIDKRFGDWLTKKYGSQSALAKAWGDELKRHESLDKHNVSPFPGWFDRGTPRIADQLAFHTDLQREYYAKVVKAIRDTGYKGTIVGSNWHGMAWPAHLCNLLTDYEIGHIDRHSYAEPSLTDPGHGILSKGFTQVEHRAFAVSEWAGRGHRFGYNSLDEAIVAAYGMGLQGWDISLHNALRRAEIRNSLSHNVNDTVNCFSAIVQYPALARLVYRDDVRQGDVVVNRRVSIPRLLETGNVGFEEPFSPFMKSTVSDYAAPKASLAAGRVVMEFVDGPAELPVIDRSAPYIDPANGVVRSTTGQLAWHWKGAEYFTIDTPGTKGVVGRGGGMKHELGEVTIDLETPFAHLYVTALDKDADIRSGKRLLITAIARTVNKGTVFDELSDHPLTSPPADDGPVLIEPVKATIALKGRKAAKVFALDHEGRKPQNAMEIPVKKTADGVTFTLDGAAGKAVYYVVEL